MGDNVQNNELSTTITVGNSYRYGGVFIVSIVTREINVIHDGAIVETYSLSDTYSLLTGRSTV